MIVISERVNGLFKSVEKAIENRDEEFIRQLAKEQVEAGADIIDINTGPGQDNPSEVMRWLVETVQKEVNVPLSIDTPDMIAMEAGLKAVKGKAMINSATAEEEKMNTLFPLAKKYNADIICLTMEKGIPNDANTRAELAMVMLAKAMEYEIPIENIYLDPLVLPVGAAQDQGPKVLEALDLFRTLHDPAPKTVVGLSNISNLTKNRPILNRTYLVMLMAHGLTAAIMDPTDRELMSALKTAEVLLNKRLYADGYLKA